MTEETVPDLIMTSHSTDFDSRYNAASTMGKHLPNPDVERRLVEMLTDHDVAVQVCAAESLVTGGGRTGLLAVLTDLGERLDDPDTDSMVTKLQELQGSQRTPILQDTRAILAEGTTPSVRRAADELERLFGCYV